MSWVEASTSFLTMFRREERPAEVLFAKLRERGRKGTEGDGLGFDALSKWDKSSGVNWRVSRWVVLALVAMRGGNRVSDRLLSV